MPAEFVVSATNEAEVRSGIVKILRVEEPPTAIFAYQDSIAALVYKTLEDMGVSIPKDISVVGFDDLELATYLSPRLTTVGTHIDPLASEFVRLLFDRIKEAPDLKSPRQIVVTPKLVVRSSSAPPRQDAALTIKEIMY
jgi:DNA-binding LacI/PurR family transcriptional regulator